MPHYFLDTSALAKLYRKEIGSDLVDRVVAEPDSRRLISRFTILEMESVLALKFRTGEIDAQSMLIARRRLEADLGSRRLLVATVSDDHLREVVRILEPQWLIGVGEFAIKRAIAVLAEGKPPVRLGQILHPSPACPASNIDWVGKVTAQLHALGVWD